MIIAMNRQGDPSVGEASKPIARSLLWPSVFGQSILTQPPSSLVRRGIIIAMNRQGDSTVGEASKRIARSLLWPLVFAQSILTQPPLSGLAIIHILMSVLETALKPNLLPP